MLDLPLSVVCWWKVRLRDVGRSRWRFDGIGRVRFDGVGTESEDGDRETFGSGGN